ncbi:hypothetical protein IWZ03DRAFT_361431 [Phyllosticta citriasiana]|uniref:Uncharacterized protein n=1 Tax=Phyllosticta citriasiana TaxID=595635 RepID=A0ABR1KIE0_9PEZI
MRKFLRLLNGGTSDNSNDANQGPLRVQSKKRPSDEAEMIQRTAEQLQKRAQHSECQKQKKELIESSKLNQQLQIEKENLSAEIGKKSQRITALEGELSNQQKNVERWKEHSNSFANKVQKLNEELQEANKKTESVVAQLRTIQLQALKQVQSGWTAVEDSKVRDAAENLQAKIRAWAKKYSAPSLREPLEKFGFSGWESLVDFKHPFLIVVALLSEHVRVNLFGNPFHLVSFNGDYGAFSNDGSHLNSVYEKLLKDNVPRSQEFRNQLLRIYFPKSQLGQIGLDSSLIHPEVPHKVYRNITRNFFNWFASLLSLDEKTVQPCYEELLQIVLEAGTLNSHLATQRTLYIWQSAAPFLGQGFTVSSPYVKADRLNRLDDEEDDKCDGKPIRIILGLVLSACGNNDGEDYDKDHRVLTKASVWIDDRKVGVKANKEGHQKVHRQAFDLRETQW